MRARNERQGLCWQQGADTCEICVPCGSASMRRLDITMDVWVGESSREEARQVAQTVDDLGLQPHLRPAERQCNLNFRPPHIKLCN